MTVADPNQASLLELVGFSADELAHPVDLLTVEMAALEADVSVTTVDSAITSAAIFRELVLQAAIRSVVTRPSADVWAALHRSVGRSTGSVSLADVLEARVQQLAGDPAFPLLLSGFERLDDPGTSGAVNDTLRALILELWPFIQTVRAAAGKPVPSDPSEDVLFGVMLCLLGDAMRRVLAPTELPETDEAFAQVLSDFVEDIIDSGAASISEGLLLPPTKGQAEPIQGPAELAIEAGVRLLRANAIEPSTSLTVADASERCGVSTASFYRIFGSMAEFERQLLEQVGGSLADGFGEHFFNGDLRQVEGDGVPQFDVEQFFDAYYTQAQARHRHHAETVRPGVQVLPWLNSPLLGPLIRISYRKRFKERGKFFTRLANSFEANLPYGLTADLLASFMGASSMVIEFMMRNAPDEETADAYLASRSRNFFETIFVGRPNA